MERNTEITPRDFTMEAGRPAVFTPELIIQEATQLPTGVEYGPPSKSFFLDEGRPTLVNINNEQING